MAPCQWLFTSRAQRIAVKYTLNTGFLVEYFITMPQSHHRRADRPPRPAPWPEPRPPAPRRPRPGSSCPHPGGGGKTAKSAYVPPKQGESPPVQRELCLAPPIRTLPPRDQHRARAQANAHPAGDRCDRCARCNLPSRRVCTHPPAGDPGTMNTFRSIWAQGPDITLPSTVPYTVQ